MTSRAVLLLVLLCLGLAAPALSPPADPVGAQALWEWATTESADLTHPAYIDATEAAARLRPWHPGYSEARGRIQAVGRARLEARQP